MSATSPRRGGPRRASRSTWGIRSRPCSLARLGPSRRSRSRRTRGGRRGGSSRSRTGCTGLGRSQPGSQGRVERPLLLELVALLGVDHLDGDHPSLVVAMHAVERGAGLEPEVVALLLERREDPVVDPALALVDLSHVAIGCLLLERGDLLHVVRVEGDLDVAVLGVGVDALLEALDERGGPGVAREPSVEVVERRGHGLAAARERRPAMRPARVVLVPVDVDAHVVAPRLDLDRRDARVDQLPKPCECIGGDHVTSALMVWRTTLTGRGSKPGASSSSRNSSPFMTGQCSMRPSGVSMGKTRAGRPIVLPSPRVQRSSTSKFGLNRRTTLAPTIGAHDEPEPSLLESRRTEIARTSRLLEKDPHSLPLPTKKNVGPS